MKLSHHSLHFSFSYDSFLFKNSSSLSQIQFYKWARRAIVDSGDRRRGRMSGVRIFLWRIVDQRWGFLTKQLGQCSAPLVTSKESTQPTTAAHVSSFLISTRAQLRLLSILCILVLVPISQIVSCTLAILYSKTRLPLAT